MKIRLLFLSIAILLFAGCSRTPVILGGDWSSSQEEEFLNILKEDKYASICGLEPMYAAYIKEPHDEILTKLMIEYTKNLANSCISTAYINSSARLNPKRYFEVDIQKVSDEAIKAELKAGKTIEEILTPYIPTNPQFQRLLTHYHQMKGSSDKENLKKVKLNIERTKIMKQHNWDTYVFVNVPEFKFRLCEGKKVSMNFPVIVGMKSWQTPIFSSTMKYIVLNPTWNVPDNIARDEIIPKLVRNPNYLASQNMIVRRDYDPDSEPIDPKSINWKQYTSKEYKTKGIPYKIIEKSSSRNALGTVKFMFPNKFSVYMHDTQTKKLFASSVRAYSHGCIRLSQPKELLKHVSSRYTSIPYDGVEKQAKSKKICHVGLKNHIQVQIAYFTALVDETGKLIFLNDIYGFDAQQAMKGTL